MAYNGPVSAFFLDLATGEHDFDNDTIMIALYEDRDVMSADLQAYTTTGECVGVNYPAGGIEIFVSDGYPKKEGQFDMAVRFEDLTFINISASIGAALIYNGENGRAIRCLDFGDNQLVTTSDFNITFPPDTDPPVNIIMIKR